MHICIHNDGMAKESNLPVVTVRLKEPEFVRFQRLLEVAKQRSRGKANKTDVMRELLMLDDLNLLTKDDVLFFHTGEKNVSLPEIIDTTQISEIMMVGGKKKGNKANLEAMAKAMEAGKKNEQFRKEEKDAD